jgi:enterochelin esterase-like enzyme
MKATLIKHSTRLAVAFFVAILTVRCVSSSQEVVVSPLPATEPIPVATRLAEDPYYGLPVQIVDRSWTEQELLARSELEQSLVWADGDELTFFYQSAADAVYICCGIQLQMQRVEESNAWVLTVRIDKLAQAVISYSFTPYQNGHPTKDNSDATSIQVWRGPEAPRAPERTEILGGQVITHTIESAALGESRQLSVYLPPEHDSTQQYPVVYAADGDLVDGFATVLDPLVMDSAVPAVIVVGVHSAEYTNTAELYDRGRDLRMQEYLWGENRERFAAHERFFVYEVSEWAEQNLGASPDREQRAVFGFSNGGGFAVTMGIRHPRRYGNILAFSLGMGKSWGDPVWSADTAPRHYLVAGTLEPFQKTTDRWAKRLTRLNVEHVYYERICGHDLVMWEEEFPKAVAWAFQNQ